MFVDVNLLYWKKGAKYRHLSASHLPTLKLFCFYQYIAASQLELSIIPPRHYFIYENFGIKFISK